MRTVEEIKKRKGEESVSDIFGITVDEWLVIVEDMTKDSNSRLFESRVEEAVRVMENVLKIEQYSSESLLRFLTLQEVLRRRNDSQSVLI